MINEKTPMGHMKHKYTKSYFLKTDTQGNPTNIGVEGIEDFKKGNIRKQDKDILSRLKFNGRTVLDIGFGRGEAIKYALEHGACKVVGVDFSEEACAIARDWLKIYNLTAELHCADILDFVKSKMKQNDAEKFDIILMLDVIEHIPRSELKEILMLLPNLLALKSVICINTPVFQVDNDVLSEGLKPQARDTSDDHQETMGMHCNRYTKESLRSFMKDCGFKTISYHFYVNQLYFPNYVINNAKYLWLLAWVKHYPLRLSAIIKKEIFEYVYPINIKSKLLIRIIKQLFPPVIVTMMIKVAIALGFLQSEKKHVYKPSWHYIKGGNLKDRQIFVDPYNGYWQREIIEGSYDQFFFDYIKQLNLNGKNVFEIGAHIGYHAMNFAQIVGPTGMVFAFEPNQYNIERFNLILTKSEDLAKRIKIFDVALSNKTGETEFYFSRHIDDGRSTGSFIQGAHTPFKRSEYEKVGFKKQTVRTVTLDQISANLGIKESPALIKIDVEGAENFVLKGGEKMISQHRPMILIEIHTIYNMLQTCIFFNKINYHIKLLNESEDGRCFISALIN